MSIEAMKQALDALEKISMGGSPEWANDVIPALRQAIEQAEKQEPDAWLSGEGLELKQVFVKQNGDWTEVPFTIGRPIPMTPEHLPQYIATDGKPMESGGGGVRSRPRKEWVGLTDQEVSNLWFDHGGREKLNGYDFAQSISAKLKEKNT